jgi:2-oxoglutarate dehydrogenase E1 component
LLPHGYEGQGPEHSSARLERFLQLCAEYNMIVANITLPANYFHFLRRQLAWPFRKPAVVMSPKSLLRHPMCVSSIDELTQGGFHELIDDWTVNAKDVKKVLVCSGKVYFDLYNEQQAKKRTDVAIVRMEQLFPLPEKQLDALVEKYKGAKFVWVQEEPENMGAWNYILRMYRKINWELSARKASASPATGYNKVHVKEQEEIVRKAFL